MIFFVTTIAGVATVIVVTLFHTETVILTALVGVLTILLLALRWSIPRLALSMIVFVLGIIAEITMVNSGAWLYPTSNIFGIAYWVPFVWVNAALFFAELKILLDKKFSRA